MRTTTAAPNTTVAHDTTAAHNTTVALDTTADNNTTVAHDTTADNNTTVVLNDQPTTPAHPHAPTHRHERLIPSSCATHHVVLNGSSHHPVLPTTSS